MAARTFALATTVATALVLGLAGLARAETPSTWTDPGAPRAAQAPVDKTVADKTDAPKTAVAQAEPPRAQSQTQTAQPQPRAERRPRGYRSARFGGGGGATWKTGRDAYGFMGSYGGCRYRGHAGPGGYRLDRSC